jgi:5'(3')-deoxyribonucleotidase
MKTKEIMMPTTKRIVYVDMDDVLCNYSGAYLTEITLDPENKYPQSQYGFFVNLQPIEGAVDAIKALIKSDKYEPYIFTAPSIHNPFSYTEKRIWTEKHLGFELVDRLIICSKKGLLKGDFLIDDNFFGKGQENFEGELINFGSEEFTDWNDVRARLAL